MKTDFIHKVSRYIASGIATFAVEYSTFLVLVYVLEERAWISQAASYSVALVVNFLLLRQWAFKAQSDNRAQVHFAKYALLVMINLPLTTSIIYALTSSNVPPFAAKIIVVALTTGWNYLVYDKLIFKGRFSSEDIV